MRKKQLQRRLNHYPLWKYVVLVVSFIVMLLSALPTWYGEDAAIQIGSSGDAGPDIVQLAHELAAQGIAVKRIDQQPERTVVVLQQPSQQTEAKQILAALFGVDASDSRLTLAMSPAAPDWLQQLGFVPIKLGLDLRGGVQFLLEVDLEPVYQAHATQLRDSLRQTLRQQGIRQARVTLAASDRLTVLLPSTEAEGQVRQYLRQQAPQWQVVYGAGNQLILMMSPEEQRALRQLTVQQNLQTMRSRIEELGITEALVQRQGENRIRIELPGVQDPAAAKRVLGATASLAFHVVKAPGSDSSILLSDAQGQPVRMARQPVLTGEHIVDARAGFGEMGAAEVNITLDRTGGQLMSSFSRQHIGKAMATVFSEYSRDAAGNTEQHSQVISVAKIQSQLGNRFRITGAGNIADAQELALLLRAGSLTAPVTIVEERTIGPTLGAENIDNGFAALALGLGMTLVFMALWYRRLGWVANIALIANMVMLFGLLALIPGAVLTLPGIAGLVLTVGMAVDTNVLIFERIRDKLQEGRSLAQAIDQGFRSAFTTIFDANFTTMITAVVLYAVGNGPVQGFALTLGLGLLTSMFTGIFASRALINLVWGRDARREVRI
ncbi:protein translocase subunit SecD [Photobacterium sp. TY1-4]|uniref:protein translocase subunit SecD n=1 Tax=Photobacterium sp. TY1-4 TaxID=2899122 RepID=UPI0021BFE3FD|nr:protein translocase subunit SecD [Photobacterium sp. TY1-4]UXI04427.1 protein translocase subunit SecD [Photobacterium sp. TY1-4]